MKMTLLIKSIIWSSGAGLDFDCTIKINNRAGTQIFDDGSGGQSDDDGVERPTYDDDGGSAQSY